MRNPERILSQLTAIGAEADREAPEDPGRFAAYAAQALEDLSPWSAAETAAVLSAYAGTGAEDLPVSRSVFGDLELLAYRSERLSLQVLFWLDATTTVHDHGFCGAFKLMAGRSLQGTYAFDAREKASAALDLGALRRIGTEALSPGSCRRIPPGPALIHSLFHLDRPSVTCVLRTRATAVPGGQRDYVYPHLALLPSQEDPRLARRVEALRCLAAVDQQALATAHAAFLDDAGPAGLFMSLTGGVWQQLPASARQAAAAGFVRGSFMREVLVSFVFDQATLDAARLRRAVRDEEARGLLGCLATATDAKSCADAAIKIGMEPAQAGVGFAGLARRFGGESLAGLDAEDLAGAITAVLLGEKASGGRQAASIAPLKRHPLFARLIS